MIRTLLLALAMIATLGLCRGVMLCDVAALGDEVAEEKVANVHPRDFGFEIPAGIVRPGESRRVVTHDYDGAKGEAKPVVAQLYVRVGENAIVLLPDGRLVERKVGEFDVTDRPLDRWESPALAKHLIANEFKGFRTRATKHYVFVYNTSEPFADATTATLESMLLGIAYHAEAQKFEIHKPSTPLVVVMFRTNKELQAYRRLPLGVSAFYDTVSNRVLICEESGAATRPNLALREAIATIAHEGAHQILNNIGIQQRLSIWPIWLSEGLAEYFSPTKFDVRQRWKGAGQPNDMRLHDLESYLQSRETVDGKTIESTVAAVRLSSTGYAAAWSLTHYLAQKQRTAFKTYLRDLSKLGPLQTRGRGGGGGISAQNVSDFKDRFGDAWATHEARLIAHLKTLPYRDPYGDLPHYLAMAYSPVGKGRKESHLFHRKADADRWSETTVAAWPVGQRTGAKTLVREFANRLAAEQFAIQWLRQ